MGHVTTESFPEKPVIAILASIPLGRLLDEFSEKDHRILPWIFALFHALARQQNYGYDIHWITLSKLVSKPECRHINGQTLHIIPQGSIALDLLTMHLRPSFQIRKLLNSIRPSLVHVWGVEESYAMACKNFKGKKLLSYQGALTAYCERAPQVFVFRMHAFLERFAVKHYGQITCESPWAVDRVREIAPDSDVSLMEYGVEESFFHLDRTPSDTPSCFFGGTIYELKGISYLVEAFRHPDLAHVQLYIAGKGSLTAALKAESTPNIHWLGAVSRETLQQHLSSAWCLVHPTLGDNSPNIVKEARVMGLPVITTEEGGQTQYVKDGESGYIIPIRDSTAIREAVLKLTHDRETALNMGCQGRQECRALLNVNRTVEGCLTRYRTMLNSDF